MLKIAVDEAGLNLLHKAMLDSGGDGIKQAMVLRTIRNVLDNLVEAFNRQQVRMRKTKLELVLNDGLLDTLREAMSPRGPHYGWPSRSGRLLQGLDLRNALPCGQSQQSDDYCCKLTFGPPQARQFGSYCALFVYGHLSTTGKILWIGRETLFAERLEEFLAHA